MLATFKFSDEEYISPSIFNSRRVTGCRFVKNSKTGAIQLGLVFNSTDVVNWLYKDWKGLEDKVILICSGIAKLSLNNVVNPLTEDETGLLIRPEGIPATERVLTMGSGDPGKEEVSIRQFIHIEDVLVIDRDIKDRTMLFFILDNDEELRAVNWTFPDKASFFEYNKIFVNNRVTILTIEMS